MNPLVDDIFDIFPLEYCDSFERMDLFHFDNNGHTQEGCRLLPESMLEEYILNSDFPAIVDFAGPLPTPAPSSNDLMNYNQDQEILISPHLSLCSSSSSTSSQKSPPAKRNTRIGFCEHPKHVAYRQSHSVITADTHNSFQPQHYHHHHHHHHHRENHCQKHICKKLCRHHHYLHHLKQQQQDGGLPRPTDTAFIATTPRRGRPPKGAKPSETTMPPPLVNDAATTDLTFSMDYHHQLTTTTSDPCSLPVENDDSHYTAKINYHIPMTTRPLPKRLEPVVGKSNIHVCLTCLKRSDMDVDYLLHPTYIAPQSSKKKKKVLSSPNLA